MPHPSTRSEPPGTPTRRAALRLLDAVLRRGLPLEAALPAATRELAREDDRGFAHAIAAETLRRLADLDELIDSATQRPLPADAKARFALRIALVQALALGTPHHAAIATVLPLIDGGPRKLVHGVFGALMRREAALPEVASLPPEVAERWREVWGAAAVVEAATAWTSPPPVDLSLRDPAETDTLAAELGGVSLASRHVRLTDPGPIAALPGFDDGRWWVQDIAASLPARLLGNGAGRVIDVGAAPGGKTLQLAAAGWQVSALDISATRLERLRENLARTGLAAEVVAADALDWTPPAPADAVLLDAPCSATGIFRRHPDVLYRATPAVIAEMAALQARLLARAADWVLPGGRLIYATCSLEQAEGEDRIARFLNERSDFRLAPPAEGELPVEVTPLGWVRTLPGTTLAEQGGCDGFFIARFEKAR